MNDRKMFAVFSLVVGMLLAGCTVKRPIGTHYFVGPSIKRQI